MLENWKLKWAVGRYYGACCWHATTVTELMSAVGNAGVGEILFDTSRPRGEAESLSVTGERISTHEFDSVHTKSRNFGCALRRAVGVHLSMCGVVTPALARGLVSFHPESRVTPGDKVTPRAKEWRGHGQPSPFKSRVSSPYDQRAGCNVRLRNSLVFIVATITRGRSKRNDSTDGLYRQAQIISRHVWGMVCSLISLGVMNRQETEIQ